MLLVDLGGQLDRLSPRQDGRGGGVAGEGDADVRLDLACSALDQWVGTGFEPSCALPLYFAPAIRLV